MDLLMATAIHPLFKLPVVRLINPGSVSATRTRLLDEVQVQAAIETSGASSAEDDDEDDFFKVIY